MHLQDYIQCAAAAAAAAVPRNSDGSAFSRTRRLTHRHPECGYLVTLIAETTQNACSADRGENHIYVAHANGTRKNQVTGDDFKDWYSANDRPMLTDNSGNYGPFRRLVL